MDAVIRFAQAIQQEPKTHRTPPRALLVGGFVRDSLLGFPTKDADVEVYGVAPERLSVLLQELFPRRVTEVGKSFGIAKIHLDQGLGFDVALPRRESKTAAGHKGFAVTSDPELDPKEAARRRDFTCNAMMMDPLTGELFDYYGGQEDLKHRVLRMVDPATFIEDPLRVYRAVQFAARLECELDPKSFIILRDMVQRGELETLSKERITDEWKKLLLKADRPSLGFELMKKLGVINRFFPELAPLETTPQELEWHPEGDVWIHTMMVIDQAARITHRESSRFTEHESLEVMLGALCHDLGKPSTTKMGEKDGKPRIRSLGHEEAGVEPALCLLRRFTFGEDLDASVGRLVADHLKAGMLYIAHQKQQLTDTQYQNATRKLLKRLHPTSWRVFLAVAEADFRGRTVPEATQPFFMYGEFMRSAIETHALDRAAIQPLVLGRDVLERGIEPGPLVGQFVKQIEDWRDQGTIQTREEALKRLDQLIVNLKARR